MHRIISIIMSLALMLSSFTAFAQNDAEAVSNEATVQSNLDEKLVSSYKLLSRLGVVEFEEELLDSNTPVTTKEFAYMTLRAMNVRTSLPSGSVLGSEMSYYGFKAQKSYTDPVTYAEAARVALKTIGYSAALLGIKEDDFSGWLNTANKLKVFAGVNAYSEDNVTYPDAVNIWANVMEINLMMPDRNADGTAVYREREGTTLLTKYHNLSVITGVVDANENTGLYGESAIGENQIAINGEAFLTSYDESKYYIGYNVMAYYFNSGDEEGKIIFLRPNETKNTVFRLDARDLLDYDEYEYTYLNGKKEKTIEIDKAAVIYNQKYLNAYTDEYMLPDNGEVLFIDNNRDGEYDVVVISAYEKSIVVKYITEWDMFVSDKYNVGDGISLDETKYESLELIDANANRISIEQIKNGDVITIARSADKKIMTAIVGSEYVVGKLTKVENDGEDIFIYIGEEAYPVSAATYERLKPELIAGSTYRCVFDYCGKIVDMTTTGVGVYKYGYLKIAYYEKNQEYLTFKILTEDGEFIIFKGADKIAINGKGGIEARYVLSLEWADFKPQLIRYRNNSDGEITSIEMSEVTQNPSTMLHRINSTLSHDKWYSAQSSFSGKVAVSDNAVVFTIPDDTRSDDDRLYGASRGVKALNNGVDGYFAYKEKANDMQASVIVAVGNPISSARDGYGNIMIVSKTVDTINEDSEAMLEINGVTRNGAESFMIRKDDISETIDYQPGDIVRYTIYEGNVAMDIVKLFDYEAGRGLDNLDSLASYEDSIEYPATASFNNYNVSVMGYVVDTDGKFVKVNQNRKSDASYNESNDMFYNVSGLPIFMFNPEKGKNDKLTQIKEVNIPDASTGNDPYIYIFSVYSSAKFAVVYVN